MDKKLQELLERLWVNLDTLNNHLSTVSDDVPQSDTEFIYLDVINSLRDVYTQTPFSLKTLKANKHNALLRYQEHIAIMKKEHKV